MFRTYQLFKPFIGQIILSINYMRMHINCLGSFCLVTPNCISVSNQHLNHSTAKVNSLSSHQTFCLSWHHVYSVSCLGQNLGVILTFLSLSILLPTPSANLWLYFKIHVESDHFPLPPLLPLRSGLSEHKWYRILPGFLQIPLKRSVFYIFPTDS